MKNSIRLITSLLLPVMLTANVFATERVVKIQIDNTTATIDGEFSSMDVAPYISNENTMIPLRFVANALNISDDNILYDIYTKEVTISKYSNYKVIFKLDSNSVITSLDGVISEKIMENNAKAEITDERMFIPFRELANAFDLEINWNSDTKTVTLKGETDADTNSDTDEVIDLEAILNSSLGLTPNTSSSSTSTDSTVGLGNSTEVNIEDILTNNLGLAITNFNTSSSNSSNNNSNLTGEGNSNSIDLESLLNNNLGLANNNHIYNSYGELDLEAMLNATSTNVNQLYINALLNANSNSNAVIDLEAILNATLNNNDDDTEN